MLFGENPDAEKLVAVLTHIDPTFSIPRYRDCYFNGEHIVVHTRTGGGNRECWCEEGAEHTCYQSANDAMTTHPWFVRDEDDGFDSTYANWYFKPTPEVAATLTATEGTPAERWQSLFAQLNRGEMPENAQKVADIVVPQITAALNDGESRVISI
jgi:hypothetical protein